MKRTVTPEWLDELPAQDPAALSSRRDIRRLNRIMGHAATMSELLQPALGRTAPTRIVELGAGDGRFMLRLAEEFAAHWSDVELTLIDRKDAVAHETRNGFESLGWTLNVVEGDVFDWLANSEAVADVILANLFLHQFDDAPLSRMLGLAAAKTTIFAACEPRRAAAPFALSCMVGFIGCNAVTRHDAPISVRAGFDGKEVSKLWPKNNGLMWRLREDNANLFTHTFFAERTSETS